MTYKYGFKIRRHSCLLKSPETSMNKGVGVSDF